MQTAATWLAALQSLLCACVFLGPIAARADDDTHALRGGWYRWDPYQFRGVVDGASVPTGLDIDLLTAILAPEGYDIRFEEVPWDAHLTDIATGRRDIAGGAYRTPEREAHAWFSEPYRVETDVLVVPRGRDWFYRNLSTSELLRKLSEENFRVGIVRGYSYGPEADAWLADPANAGLVVTATDDNTNLARLLRGEIDGFFADRLVAATIAWRGGVQHRLGGYSLVIHSGEIHAMFSKKTCSPETVAAFNEGLRTLKESGEYYRLVQDYGIPILLGITVNERWFGVLDMLGTIAFAISGVLIARRERYDIFGAFVLAALPAVGGGVLRDLVSGRDPIGVLRTADYVYAILGTVGAGFVFYKVRDAFVARRSRPAPTARRHWHEHIYLFFDAVGLAAFTVTGVVIAVEQHCKPLLLWGPLFAAMTGAGGGIIRDIVRADSNNPSLKGAFYPEVAVIWGFLFAVFLQWEALRLNLHEIVIGVIITMAGALATRLLALRFGIRSIFLYNRRRDSPDTLLADVEKRQVEWLRALCKAPDAPSRQGAVATGAAISDRLTALSVDRLPEAANRRFVLLQQRQARFTLIQCDVIDLAAFIHNLPAGDELFLPFAKRLDAFAEALSTPAGSPERAAFRDHLAEELPSTGASRGDERATTAFDRMAVHMAAALALDEPSE